MTDNFAFALGVAAVILFLYGPLQWFIVDLVRYRLFELRDESFDYANEHGLFDDARYVQLRAFLNASIRWAEQANGLVIPKSLATIALCPSLMKDGDGLHAAMEDDRTPRVLRDTYRRAMKLISFGTLLRSPLLLATLAVAMLILPFVAIAFVLTGTKLQPRRVQHAVERAIEADVAVSEGLAHAA